jgi:Brp/Blh family beta-carotene 15,15'-monooxygenase
MTRTLARAGLPDAPRLVAAFGAAAVLLAVGAPLAGPAFTMTACVALLVFGLPHGTLDLELIRARLSGPWTGMASLVVIYLAGAGAMWGLWRLEPVLALAAFIAIAVVHFAEDWQGSGSILLRGGLALAILALPSLAHREALDAIFVGLTNQASASRVTDALVMVAPVAIGLGLVAGLALWQAGRRDQAIGALTALAAMALLPPIVGFALYFCLFHSPRHLRDSLTTLSRAGLSRRARVVVPLTLTAGSIALLIFGVEMRGGLPDRIMAASFMTLSILTVPHMLAPMLVGRLTEMTTRVRGAAWGMTFTPR